MTVNIVSGYSGYVGAFVENGLWRGTKRTLSAPYEAIGVERDKKLIAGIVFNNFCPHDKRIEATAYSTSPRWYTQQIRDYLLYYVFVTNDCRILYGRHAESNHKARNLWRKLGAPESVLPNFSISGNDVISIIERVHHGKINT